MFTLQMLKSLKILWMLISLFIASLMKNWHLYVPLSAKINGVYYNYIALISFYVECWSAKNRQEILQLAAC